MGKHRPKYQRKKWRFTTIAFPINVLMLITLMRHFESALAIRAPLYTPQVAREARDNYQSNYEDSTAVSTGYTLSQNYFDVAPSFGGSSNDNTPAYGSADSSSSSRIRHENLQHFPNTDFMPATMTAAGQHFVDMEKGEEFGASLATRHSKPTLPQIGGMRATGRYTVPPVKIDYEINAANYDTGTEIASGSNEPGADIMQSNDAYNVASMHDLAHSQQANQHQHQQQHQHQHQHQRKPHRQPHPHYLHLSQQQLDFDTPSTHEVQSVSEEFESYKNDDDATGTTPTETKYPQLNTIKQNREQTRQQQKQQQDNLHNFEMLQYANYRQKPDVSGDLFHRGILEKPKRGEHTFAFTAIQPMQLSSSYRILHNQKQQQMQPYKSKLYQHRHSRDDDLYAEDAVKSQSKYYYTHTPVNNDLSAGYGDNLHIVHEPRSISTTHSHSHHLPITHTVHHTPASSAALSGIPLSRHVEIIKQVPIPHYQRELVPYNVSVPIEVPNPVITTVRKPIPINVPVPKTVTVPQLQLVKIPIERIKPMPVERPVPYIVEKRVPYQVEKQVAKPVYVPYPLRVPVVNTVVHKLPRHGHPHSYHFQAMAHRQAPSSGNSLYAHVLKNNHFG